MLSRYITFSIILIWSVSFSGCKKLIEVDAPVTSTNANNVYASDATAAAVLTNIYAKMSDLNSDLRGGGISGIPLYAALSADELTLFSQGDVALYPYYRNELTSLIGAANHWASIYGFVFVTNAAIEGLNNTNSLTPAVKQQLLGEAMFMRAFCYFYLVNLFGGVPLVLTTDWKTNSNIERTPVPAVYQQIIADLKEAQALLSPDYLNGDVRTAYPISLAERIRPTKWAATALLARVYLYNKDWANAEQQATAVLDNSSFYRLSSLDSVFLKNSAEAIWQLQPVRTGVQANTGEGALFVLPESGPNITDYPVYLNADLVNSFEPDDQRRLHWVGQVSIGNNSYHYSYKYKIGKVETPTLEYTMVLRLAEQYLIRAEARAALNNLEGAKADINAIRHRAGLPPATATTQPALLSAILHERRVELFTEWGHRWFDLKRSGKIEEVMSVAAVQKGGTWSSFKALYPIPQSELNANPSLVQNPGY
jgi:hypothetical protein